MPALSDAQSNSTADPQRPTDRVTVLLPPWLRRQVVADARRRMISFSVGAKLRVIRERLAEHYRDGGEGEDA
jgi:hypothetical protein